jgi:DNA-binding beta-propeller fold protein YncE
VEVYELAISGVAPALTWKGCVVLPENTFSNSVVRLDDGGFLVTKMMDTTQGFGAVNAGEITGNVFEWHPGGDVRSVEGTELSGANGITLSPDGRYLYVAALGSREIVRYDRSVTPMTKDLVSVDITPDNIRWNDAGQLLVAGGNAPPAGCAGPACQTGWSVIEVDPQTLAVTKLFGADQNAQMQGASSALQVGEVIWVGTFNDDRVAYFTRQ